ncbi:TBC-domain-containing protein [Trichodelitschia bisporula]|uniref:TBC-domain-containing protein n=1 Tax=Trichodelitschia bisporula TaxID=703511 RepID=A0A6G1I6K9_9PEZI|nr:TBC-domain-containing protein [Trichodelitschia bisporula]
MVHPTPPPPPQVEPLDTILRRGPPAGDVPAGLAALRYKVLVDGIPSNSDGMSDHRIYTWLILLNAPPLPTDTYLDLVRQGASPAHAKIRNDTFRTLATDPLFRRRVTENSLTRVLNAASWKLLDAHEARVGGWIRSPDASFSEEDGGRGTRSQRASLAGSAAGSTAGEDKSAYVGYVQGMNVLAAPFLYTARSEAEAFVAFDALLRHELPGYIRGSMEGVHAGVRLVDEVLAVCDPKLYSHLLSRGLRAEVYAFPSVLTLCACTPPLPEVLALWDFLLACGVHLNVVAVVAQLVLIREQVLGAESPNQILRSFPPLQAGKIKALTISFVARLPDELYRRLIEHVR